MLLQVYESLKEYTLQGSAVGLAANAQYALEAIHPDLLARSSFLIVPDVAFYESRGSCGRSVLGALVCLEPNKACTGLIANISAFRMSCSTTVALLSGQLLVFCGTTIHLESNGL